MNDIANKRRIACERETEGGKIRKRYEREVWGKKLTWTYHRRDCKGRNNGEERERRCWESKTGRVGGK